MPTIIAIIIFLGIFGSVFGVIFYALRKQVARVFTQKYDVLIQTCNQGEVLKKYRFLSGYLTTQGSNQVFPNMSFRLRGLLKVVVYKSGLLVGVLGQGLYLPYNQYSFKCEDGFLGSYLVIAGLSVTGNSPISALAGSSFDFDKTTALKIMLSKKKIDFIMSLVQKAQQN